MRTDFEARRSKVPLRIKSVHWKTTVEGTPFSRVESADEYSWFSPLRAGRPLRAQGLAHHEARDLPRQAPLAVPEDPHRRRDRWAGRADPRGAGADVRHGGRGAGAVVGR